MNATVSENVDQFYDSALDTPIPTPVQPIDIHDGAGAVTTTAPASTVAGAIDPSLAANGRLSAPISTTAPWRVRWQVEIAPEVRPVRLLCTNDRTVIFGVELWQLRGDQGALIGQALNGGAASIDPANGLFYHVDNLGFVVGRRLNDGESAFTLFPRYGDAFARILIARHGPHLLIASQQLPYDRQNQKLPDTSMVELHDIGNPPKVDTFGFLEDARCLVNLLRRALPIQAVLAGDYLVVAGRDRVVYFDLNLKIRAILRADFELRYLSLDPSGRAYLIVQMDRHGDATEIGTDDATRTRTADTLRLWAVQPSGVRFIDTPLPGDLSPQAPPILAPDGRVFILCTGRIAAFSAAGKFDWSAPLAKPAGAAVTPDGTLLVASTDSLLAFTADGKPRALFTIDRDTFSTAPVATPDGDLLIATPSKLLRLTTRPD